MSIRPLDPAIAAHRGLSPAERARATQRAKGVCMQFANSAGGRDAAMVQRITRGLDWHEVAALAVVLAEAADPTKLKLAKEATDDEGTFRVA